MYREDAMSGLKANPGGNIPPAQAVGRDKLCTRCWKVLDKQSLRLENERRFGKTTVLRKMQAETPLNTRSLLMEIGGLSSTTGFIEELITAIDAAIPEKGGSFKTRARNVIGAIAGMEIGSIRIPAAVKSHWREILLGCFDELATQTQDRIVFFWDEIPWMLQKIKASEGDAAVVDLLDTLRDIRQTHDRIRMVLTGSIGLHHILTAFEKKGIPSRLVNDMKSVDIGPLGKADARELASRLLIGEGIEVDDWDSTTLALYEQTGGIAFYIHSVISQLALDGYASAQLVEECVLKCLVDPSDPWEMRHFNTRLRAYYGEWEHTARAVLDKIAAEGECTFVGLYDCVSTHPKTPEDASDRQVTLDLLRKLSLDHYIVEFPTGSRRYRFKYTLLQRWWHIERGSGL
jgi:hypothetical protein